MSDYRINYNHIQLLFIILLFQVLIVVQVHADRNNA
jgi:hypothetical protein